MQYYQRRARVSPRKKNLSHRFQKYFTSLNLIKIGLISLVLGVILVLGIFVWFSRDLPTPGKLANSDLKDSTKILDRNDQLLYSFYKDYNRTYVKLDEIPEQLRQATIATEDKDFYQNQGFSSFAYLRVIKDFILYRQVTGGSTITQQLVKNSLLGDSGRTATRKIKELILALQVDKRYSKDQVLEMYLNNVDYGGTARGVETASNLYFAKKAKDLNLAQAAFLAGLPQSPSYYSPYINSDKAYITRTEYVLRRMEEEGYISRKQQEQAEAEVKRFVFKQGEQGALKAPHFVMYIRKQLIDLYGEQAVENGNMTVKTTLDYDIQKEAEKVVKEEIEKLKGFDVGNGAAVVLDPKTGAVLAMVGSKDYFDTDNDGNFNVVTAKPGNQPGSALKPVVYATALERGYTPATLLMDVATEFYTGSQYDKPYKPVNYDGKFNGPMQMRFALGNSINITAVKMLAMVGLKPVMEKAYEMGIESWEPTEEAMRNVGLSLVLGGREATVLEVTTAYSVFANKGVKKEVYSIAEVQDNRGKKIFEHEDQAGKRVFSEEVSYLISHILLDNNARQAVFGTRSSLVIPGKTVSVKTGTTDDKRDNWTVGYTPSYVVGVWVGNNDNTPMNPKIASGITGASPIWNRIMVAALKDKKDEQFEKPEKVVAVEIDAYGGGLPYSDKPKRTEYFMKGTEPTAPSTIYKKVRISKRQGNKLANSEEVARGDYDVKEYTVFVEDDPVSKDGKNRWQEGIDKWRDNSFGMDDKYRPPTETSDHKYDGENKSEEKKEEKKEDPTPTPSSTPTPTE
jgi:penicillin-binding protein 1C